MQNTINQRHQPPAVAAATTEAFTLNAEVTTVNPTPCYNSCDTSNGCSSTCPSACTSGS
ncbi:FxLD family lanthipeptide [Nocardiopsis exhalans]|uniref:FxLD family lanthipeptide n=1 Tax=Nocardiopsis exhalans TaxID=163604 RepID=A0ABY5DCF0_9ACTN|nr:FxLD family lanthipeptide [Nocardiopsis exhalans]USY20705.1 FxLD family lanthipeptide [Nocardiopsis exhalans]